jgi:transposase
MCTDVPVGECANRIARLENMVAERDAVIVELTGRIEGLEERSGLTSRNSSKPPSSDGLSKPSTASTPQGSRSTSDRKPGKQKGGAGFGLKHVANPNTVVVHDVKKCSGCGDLLQGVVEPVWVEKRQVFDVPVVEPFVTEHRVPYYRCGCGQQTSGQFPETVRGISSYGDSVKALAVYLQTAQHIPVERACELMRDCFGLPVSAGWVSSQMGQAAGRATVPVKAIKDTLTAEQVVHCDETGTRVAGTLTWVHVVCTGLLTFLGVHAKRGKKATDSIGVLPSFSGVGIHDGWAPYKKYENMLHGLCNAHHIRELRRVVETTGQGWAEELIECLTGLHHTVKNSKTLEETHLDEAILTRFVTEYDRLILEGIKHNPLPERKPGQRGRLGRGKTRALVDRLDTYREDVLRFATDYRVSFDNNQAERDVRMVKLQNKISGGWRTLDGATNFLILRSYLSTGKKHKQNRLAIIKSLYTHEPWMIPNPHPG